MAARNDITGAEIKSGILSAEGRANWDKAFAKKSAAEWIVDEPFIDRILDADGWREGDGVTIDTPVSYKEFCRRINLSTVIGTLIDN
jgi:hypothetical protein